MRNVFIHGRFGFSDFPCVSHMLGFARLCLWLMGSPSSQHRGWSLSRVHATVDSWDHLLPSCTRYCQCPKYWIAEPCLVFAGKNKPWWFLSVTSVWHWHACDFVLLTAWGSSKGCCLFQTGEWHQVKGLLNCCHFQRTFSFWFWGVCFLEPGTFYSLTKW